MRHGEDKSRGEINKNKKEEKETMRNGYAEKRRNSERQLRVQSLFYILPYRNKGKYHVSTLYHTEIRKNVMFLHSTVLKKEK